MPGRERAPGVLPAAARRTSAKAVGLPSARRSIVPPCTGLAAASPPAARFEPVGGVMFAAAGVRAAPADAVCRDALRTRAARERATAGGPAAKVEPAECPRQDTLGPAGGRSAAATVSGAGRPRSAAEGAATVRRAAALLGVDLRLRVRRRGRARNSPPARRRQPRSLAGFPAPGGAGAVTSPAGAAGTGGCSGRRTGRRSP